MGVNYVEYLRLAADLLEICQSVVSDEYEILEEFEGSNDWENIYVMRTPFLDRECVLKNGSLDIMSDLSFIKIEFQSKISKDRIIIEVDLDDFEDFLNIKEDVPVSISGPQNRYLCCPRREFSKEFIENFMRKGKTS